MRRVKTVEHENNERWVLSYADFITLLFAFFVVMYSISSVNEGKYKVLSETMVQAFRKPNQNYEPISLDDQSGANQFSVIEIPDWMVPLEISKDEGGEDDATNKMGEGEEEGQGQADFELDEINERIRESLSSYIGDELIAVKNNDLWIEVEIKSSLLFDSGSASIAASAEPIITQIGEILVSYSNLINVEGHTDNIPIATDIYPSNWELSAARAVSVVQVLIRSGVEPKRLSAVGHGEFKPIASNETLEGQAQNRRVVVIISKDMPVEDEKILQDIEDDGLMEAEQDPSLGLKEPGLDNEGDDNADQIDNFIEAEDELTPEVELNQEPFGPVETHLNRNFDTEIIPALNNANENASNISSEIINSGNNETQLNSDDSAETEFSPSATAISTKPSPQDRENANIDPIGPAAEPEPRLKAIPLEGGGFIFSRDSFDASDKKN